MAELHSLLASSYLAFAHAKLQGGCHSGRWVIREMVLEVEHFGSFQASFQQSGPKSAVSRSQRRDQASAPGRGVESPPVGEGGPGPPPSPLPPLT